MDPHERLFALYQTLLNEAHRLREARRELVTFYMTLNTGGIAAIGFLFSQALSPVLIVLLCGGMCIACVFWFLSAQYYQSISRAKYKIIYDVEDNLAGGNIASIWRPIREEWEIIETQYNNPLSKFFRAVKWAFNAEYMMPFLFILGYVMIASLFTPERFFPFLPDWWPLVHLDSFGPLPAPSQAP